jgi:DnaJ-class molecular chaperone
MTFEICTRVLKQESNPAPVVVRNKTKCTDCDGCGNITIVNLDTMFCDSCESKGVL